MNFKYYKGRYFINPLIGCEGKCIYCYLNEQLKNKNIVRKNTKKVNEILKNISCDSHFVPGAKGSIISIGSYCDIFPLHKINLCLYSVEWIIECLKFGNPVQIISKNRISDEIIGKIARKVLYKNQLVYSTTITTFKQYMQIEKNTSTPIERLKTLEKFEAFGIPTNVMIKPFINGITNLETDNFITYLKKFKVRFCVIGDFYIVNDGIKKFIERADNQINTLTTETILDCTETVDFETIKILRNNPFYIKLKAAGIETFLKSSCVNSNILNVPNRAYEYNVKNNFCVDCGLCSK